MLKIGNHLLRLLLILCRKSHMLNTMSGIFGKEGFHTKQCNIYDHTHAHKPYQNHPHMECWLAVNLVRIHRDSISISRYPDTFLRYNIVII